MSDSEFVSAFEACTFPPEEFHHREHVRLAWIYLARNPLLEALTRFAESLRRFATNAGAAAKYHETITFAFLFLIHERMQRNAAATFDEFAAANADLVTWKPSVLERYYSSETLASELARRTFVMPDFR
ncbi:MAG TPA: hypothetical protein VEU30_08320 [Thermoanaerobaculia bacterium]|nr:hypothetical protein [Thermoanaerobaculia bacterium]